MLVLAGSCGAGGDVKCDGQPGGELGCGTGRMLYCCPDGTAIEDVLLDRCKHTVYPACFCCDQN